MLRYINNMKVFLLSWYYLTWNLSQRQTQVQAGGFGFIKPPKNVDPKKFTELEPNFDSSPTVNLLEIKNPLSIQSETEDIHVWRNPVANPITYGFIKNSHFPKYGNWTKFQEIVRLAFDTWEKGSILTEKTARGLKSYKLIKFRQVQDIQQAEIRISFQSGEHTKLPCSTPFDGKYTVDISSDGFLTVEGSQLGHAYRPDSRKPRFGEDNFSANNIEGDLHFDAEERWIFDFITEETMADEEDAIVEIFAVAVHEIGHSIGFAHNFIDSNSIMYPAMSQDWDRMSKTLPEVDREAMFEKYGKFLDWTNFERDDGNHVKPNWDIVQVEVVNPKSKTDMVPSKRMQPVTRPPVPTTSQTRLIEIVEDAGANYENTDIIYSDYEFLTPQVPIDRTRNDLTQTARADTPEESSKLSSSRILLICSFFFLILVIYFRLNSKI